MNRKTIIFVGAVALTVLAVASWLERRSRFPMPDSHSVSSSASSGGSAVSSAPGADVSSPVQRGASAGVGAATPTGAPDGAQYGYGEAVAHGGLWARARVGLGADRETVLTPNQLGQFPQVYVQARQTVPVVVEYPQDEPGAAVVVQMMDGGQLVAPERPAGIDHDLVRLVYLDEHRQARFAVRVSGNEGMHRVVLTKGADQKQLDFWVGQERLAQR
jgi:hypothetical protein